MNKQTSKFQVNLTNFIPRDIAISYDDDGKDPVSYYLKNGTLWGLDLAHQSLPFLTSSSVVLDIGAHIGTYSVIASTFTNNKVIAIEASPTNFSLLKDNKEQNNLKHLEIHNIGAGDKVTELSFVDRGSGAHMAGVDDDPADLQKVPCVPLDSILDKEDAIDFVKLDIEGYEINALEGMQKTLDKFEPPILFECNGHTLKFFEKTANDLFRYLEERFGYRIFVLLNGLLPINSYEPFPFGVTDCYAIKDKHLSKIAKNIMLPLSFKQRLECFKNTEETGNDDIKRYVEWYKKRVKF